MDNIQFRKSAMAAFGISTILLGSVRKCYCYRSWEWKGMDMRSSRVACPGDVTAFAYNFFFSIYFLLSLFHRGGRGIWSWYSMRASSNDTSSMFYLRKHDLSICYLLVVRYLNDSIALAGGGPNRPCQELALEAIVWWAKRRRHYVVLDSIVPSQA